MSQTMGINAIHLNYLTPLTKWKVMDVRSLLKYSKSKVHYGSFMRIIQKLQRLKIINSMTEPVTRVKYVYLTDEGIKLTSANNKLLIANEDSPEHDAKASELARKFVEHGYVEKAFLDHEFYSKNSIIPDASLLGSKDGHSFSIAFEFELNRKSKSRVIAKVKNYFSSTDFDYVMYFFNSESLLKSYEKFIREELGKKYLNRIMFVGHPTGNWKQFPFSGAHVLFRGEWKKLYEIFE